jgi:hypothetical protein
VSLVVDCPGLVWRLEGSALRDVQCWVTQDPSALITVRVIHGDETFLDEMYADLQTAMARAHQLQSDLVKAGWSVMPEKGKMSEIITELEYRIVDTTGSEYYVSVAAEMSADGRWEAWLEFVPLDDSDVLVTGTETHQATRAAVEHWATTLSRVYVEAAFSRAAPAAKAPLATRVVARALAPEIAATAPTDIDPFALMTDGKSVLRAALRPLSRAQLMAVISSYGLNPPGKSLAWLTHALLVTFIATAVEAQLLLRRR